MRGAIKYFFSNPLAFICQKWKVFYNFTFKIKVRIEFSQNIYQENVKELSSTRENNHHIAFLIHEH